MAHHHHHDGDSYYLDQLSLVALAGAFGFVCLSLYFWQEQMLKLILGPQFHLFILLSGIALVVLVVIRASVLWQMAGKTEHAHTHAHDHEHHHHHHAHDHDHVHSASCDHADDHHHHVHTEHCDHDHDHAHGHSHSHDHGHDHDHDHDHGWAPWRYVVLLVPIMLFLLGLPARGPKASADNIEIDMTEDLPLKEILFANIPAMAANPLNQTAFLSVLSNEEADKKYTNCLVEQMEGKFLGGMPFKELEKAARSSASRDYYEGNTVEIKGQFVPHQGSDRRFTLVRFRIQCCAADAIPLQVPMFSRESLKDLKPMTWVSVRGRVEYQENQNGNGFITVLRVPRRSNVKEIPPMDDPYEQ